MFLNISLLPDRAWGNLPVSRKTKLARDNSKFHCRSRGFFIWIRSIPLAHEIRGRHWALGLLVSVACISWALKQETGRSTAKFVLVALANYANEEGCCYPCIMRLEKDTEQDRKTIMSNIARLREIGLIRDTGKRVGATNSVPVYQLINRQILPVPKTAPLSSPENGTAIGDKQSRFSVKQSRFSVEAVPKTGHRSVSDPSGTTQREFAGGEEQGEEGTQEPFPPQILTMARVAVLYLNELAGRKFRESGDNLLFVARRLMEKDVSIEGVKTMLQRQSKLWLPRPDMAQHLTPHTLFGPNFSKYYDDRDEALPALDDKGRARPLTQKEINRKRELRRLEDITKTP
jgi:uncharacterized phage protein (TIGR02220 family)